MAEVVSCIICKKEAYSGLDACPHCGAIEYYMSADETVARRLKELQIEQDKTKNIILTTSHFLEGYKVTKTITIISAECVFGMDLLYNYSEAWTDLVGGRSVTTENFLREARKVCLNELRKEAINVDANAVIAVDLDYAEFSGKLKSMFFVVANGTAVKVEIIS